MANPAKLTAQRISSALSWTLPLLVLVPIFVLINNMLRVAFSESETRRSEAEALQQTQHHTLINLEEKTVEQARLLELVQDLETPVMPLLDGVVALPLVGYLDAPRAQRLTTSLLQRIANEQINCVLVDVTGMKMLDQQAFDHLVRLVQAVRLMGTDCIVTGIRPDIARGLVAYGMDATRLKTTASLRDGIALLLEEHTHTTNNYN